VRVIDARALAFAGFRRPARKRRPGEWRQDEPQRAASHVQFRYTTVFQETYMSLEIRLKYMDETGVDIHALSLTSPMVYCAAGIRLEACAGL
jgi:hypothetical protein